MNWLKRELIEMIRECEDEYWLRVIYRYVCRILKR